MSVRNRFSRLLCIGLALSIILLTAPISAWGIVGPSFTDKNIGFPVTPSKTTIIPFTQPIQLPHFQIPAGNVDHVYENGYISKITPPSQPLFLIPPLQPTTNSGSKNNISLIPLPELTPEQQKLGSSLLGLVYPETNPTNGVVNFVPAEFYIQPGSKGPSGETISPTVGSIVRVNIGIAPNSDLLAILPYIYKINYKTRENGWTVLDAWVKLRDVIQLSKNKGVRSINIPTLVELE